VKGGGGGGGGPPSSTHPPLPFIEPPPHSPPTLEDVLFPEKFLNGNFVTSCYYANKRNK